MKRRRGLSEEDRELWSRVAASTHAMHPKQPDAPAPAKGNLMPPPKAPNPALRPFRPGENAPTPKTTHDLVPPIGEDLARQPVAMDRKAHRAMTRGKLEPEARLDLHGMTLAEAHPRLIRFVLSSQDRGHRLILIITGKGKRAQDDGPIPVRTGILRHQVPQWLRLPPLASVVLQVTEAHLKHGGSGAYYIYLRRLR
ncbi:Smr/MutS family protein [Paenirhodobacter populi]|uniref:DNA mismatch repair protein MutS n=1 Tax=Paenirhodobacter populi TaxID=2306993 RepID=A0A443JH14_9RHOB|nr:Smr/MutS family protein [Sinirhodobacter populi]RWR19906.1 DNA mismatch repair protein MutS [Sinirhodobacter populi]